MNNRPEQPSQQSWYDGRAPQSDPRANQNDLALQATLAYQELITPVGAYPPRHRSQGSHTNASGSVYPGYEQGAPLNHQMPLRGGWDQPSSTHGRGASPSSPSQHLNQMNWVPSRQGSAGPSSRALEPTSFQGPLSPTDSDGMDSTSVTEDKRKRNTAASARFRVKKKQKMVDMERSMTELEKRANDLEQEAVDLRRENGWLKEIVIMKGRKARANTSSRAGQSFTERDEDSDPESDEGESSR